MRWCHRHLAVPGDGGKVCSAASSCLLGFQVIENESYSCKPYCITAKGLSLLPLLCVCVCVCVCMCMYEREREDV